MSHTKKKGIKSLKARIKNHLSLKKVTSLVPHDFTVMRSHPDYISFDPSGSAHLRGGYTLSNNLEKWILIVLLAVASAAFAGFKLLENSDLSFSLNEGSNKEQVAASVSSEAEFKEAFQNNRREARALIQKTSPKRDKTTKKYYAKAKTSKKIASHSKKASKKVSRTSKKKTIAKMSWYK